MDMRMRFGMRQLLGVLMSAVLLTVLACGSSEEETPTPKPPTPTIKAPPPLVIATPTASTAVVPVVPAGDQPVYGGVVKPVVNSHGSFDPYHVDSQFRHTTLGSVGNVWGQLLRVNLKDRVTIEGDLAESWKVTDDGATWILKIREGVKSHTGSAFTAEDAYWQMVRIVERPNGLHGNYQGCMRAFIKPIWDDNDKPLANGGAEVTGPMEMTIRLNAPSGAFPACFTSGFQAAVNSNVVKPIDTAVGGEYRDLDPFAGEVDGYGPFKFKGAVIDTFVSWERNENYYNEKLPYLDGVTIPVIPDASTRTAAFRAGQIDMMQVFETMPKRDADALVKEEGAVFPIVLAMGWRGIELNATKPPFGPLNDPDAKTIRQAVQATINREQVNELSKDGIGHIALPYFIGWEWIRTPAEWFAAAPGFDPDPAVKAKLIAESKAAMEGLGYGPSNRISVNYLCGNSARNECEVASQQLKEIYIDADVIILDGASQRERLQKGDFDMENESKGASFPDADAFNTVIYKPYKEGGFNYTGWTNPEWDALLEKEVLAVSEAERAPLLRQMADIFYEDSAFIGLVRPGLLEGHGGNWRGWVPPAHHASNFSFENVWLDNS